MAEQLEKVSFARAIDLKPDEWIDVRSPVEFALDHVTGAKNLPVLSDVEREKVGKLYCESPFDARRIGAACISRRIAHWLDEYFSEKPKDYRPLIYCWRGGQRSESLATVLREVGWTVLLLDGGYRHYRRHVVSSISNTAPRLLLIVLNGLAGAGKTLILRELGRAGEQVLNLEDLARHKGSVFGGDRSNPQPAQKRFESLLFDRISLFDLTRPVFIEAESAKIGNLNIPNPLWLKMKNSPVIEICSPRQSRARHLIADYGEWLDDLERVEESIERLSSFHCRDTLHGWKKLAREGKWEDLAASLLEEHYDRRYRPEAESKHFRAPSHRVQLAGHDKPSLSMCTGAIRKFDLLRTV